MRRGVLVFILGLLIGELDPFGWAAWRIIEARLPQIKAQSLASPSPFESVPRSSWIAESPGAFVIEDRYAPLARVHLLVIPKHRYTTMLEPPPELLGELLALARSAAVQQGIAESGFRIVINTNPHGPQTAYHLHVHVLGGEQLTERLWPYISAGVRGLFG